MNPEQIMRLVDALEVVANVLQRIGPAGIVLLALAGPALIILAILLLEFLRGRLLNGMVQAMLVETRGMVQAMQAETRGMVQAMQVETRKTLAAYQKDTQNLLHDLGGNQAQTDQYYRDNVELVKQYNRIADGLIDVVTSNTRALEQLGTIIKTRIGIGGCE